jgi:hypothetical protein
MSRSVKSKSYRSWWNRECHKVKKLCRRKFRACCNQLVRELEFDLFPVDKGTEGWITW